MSEAKWRKGAPPSIGWYDGKNWSVHTTREATAKRAAKFAEIPSVNQKQIEWTERW